MSHAERLHGRWAAVWLKWAMIVTLALLALQLLWHGHL